LNAAKHGLTLCIIKTKKVKNERGRLSRGEKNKGKGKRIRGDWTLKNED